MSFQVVFLEDAEADLDGIDEYLYQFSEKASDGFIAQVETQTLMLEENPYLYQVYEADPFFRRKVVGDYNLFYSVNEQEELVTIHRVFHQSRSVSRQLLSHRTIYKSSLRHPF